eukprot:gene16584-25437_t
MRTAAALLTLLAVAAAKHPQNVWSREQEVAAGYKEHVVSPLPHTYLADLPESFTWGD